MKKTANTIVKTNPITALLLAPATIAWCAHVTVAPEHNSINVFTKGTSKALKTTIPFGGHMFPISIVADKLLAKNAQKKPKKNITSDAINSNIP